MEKKSQFASYAMIVALVAAACLPTCVGCGKKEAVVPVSGVATYKGEPLVACVVFFTPLNVADPNLCITSAGKTDDQGRFTLYTTELKSRPGAVVGQHSVAFRFPQWGEEGEDDVYADRSQIPNLSKEYTSGTKIKFDVPPKGTSEANFDLD